MGAKNCRILLVNNLPQKVTRRDRLLILGISLTASKPTGKTIGYIAISSIVQDIIKWIFKKYPHLCARLGRSKIHSQIKFQKNFLTHAT